MSSAGGGHSDDSDEALMLAYGRGDAGAFERLYLRHKGPTYRYLLRHVTEAGVADDLHQDVWLRVVAARERYAAAARFTTWLYTLARHRLVDHWRSRGDARITSLDDDATPLDEQLVADRDVAADPDPLARAIDAEAGRRLRDALAALPGPQRDAFLLHVEAGLALDQIAALAAAPVETVKSRLRYAYRRLRAALENLQ